MSDSLAPGSPEHLAEVEARRALGREAAKRARKERDPAPKDKERVILIRDGEGQRGDTEIPRPTLPSGDPVEVVWKPQSKPQAAFVACPLPDLLFGGARSGGKLQPVSELVCTPLGWRAIGSLRVGDLVTDPTTGGQVAVIGVYPQGEVDIYRVTFDDGASCRVGIDHLWAYKLPNHLRPRTKVSPQREYARRELRGSVPDERWNTLTVGPTRDLVDALARGFRPRIPLTEPVLFTVNGRLGHGGPPPYLLGLLLGDGNMEGAAITTADAEIVAYLEAAGFARNGDTITLRARGPIRKLIRAWQANHGLRHARSWEKFLPESVFTANVEYRVEILRGLMDTDGTVDARGRCYYSTTSPMLADGVTRLVRGLGGKAYTRTKRPTYTYLGEKKNGRLAYDTLVQLPYPSALFRLTRKKDRCPSGWMGGRFEMMRAVERIEKVGREEAVCIRVASVYGLYVTSDYVVTHNTSACVGDFAIRAQKWGAAQRGIFFRRTYDELQEVLAQSREVYGRLGWKYNATERLWTSPNGATLFLRYLDRDIDADRYQGWGVSTLYFDELGNWASLSGVDRLWGILRSVHGVPIARRNTANPGGPGHAMIRDRYRLSAAVCQPYVPFKLVPLKDHPEMSIDTVFIPSTLDDNPILRKADPDYEKRLAATAGGVELYRAWRYGDWDAVAGRYFSMWDRDATVVAAANVPVAPWYPRWIAIDWGYSHPSAVYWAAWDGTTVWVYRELVTAGLTPRSLAAQIATLSKGEKIEEIYLSPDAHAKRQNERTIADEMEEEWARYGLPTPVKADDDRIGGWNLMRQLMLSGFVKISDACPNLIEKIPLAQHDPKNPEDVLKHSGDDEIDAFRYLLKTNPRAVRVPAEMLVQAAMTSADATIRAAQGLIATQKYARNRRRSMDWIPRWRQRGR